MGKKAIVCVDDDRTVLKTLEEQLERIFGGKYVYEVAESGAEALELIADLVEEGYAPVTVISDWSMPGMKGDEFLAHLHSKYDDIVKVLLTGQAPEDAIKRAYDAAKLDHYIQKPWKMEDLKKRLSHLI
ncbi:MAG: response regulator [Cyclobacteriaceae bacterium]